MKNLIKTAIAAGAIALNVVVADAAMAASFRLTLTGSGGSEIIADLEGTENADGTGVNVEEVSLVQWFMGEELHDAWENFVISQRHTYIDYNVLSAASKFSATGGKIDNVYDDVGIAFLQGTNMAANNISITRRNSYNYSFVSSNRNSHYIAHKSNRWSREEWETATLISTPSDTEQVPEPSLILGSILAAAVGVKTLKRGKKQ